MVGLDFVFAGSDTTLGGLADVVLADIEARGGEWYTRYGLIRAGSEYRAIRLTALSAALEGGEWSVDTPLTDFDLTPCEVLPENQVTDGALRSVRQPLVVAEANGEPVGLYQGRASRRMERTDRRGWLRLVGKRIAARGQKPAWPKSLPEGYQCDSVLVIAPETTLADLAARLQERGQDVVLAIHDAAAARWAVYPARDLLDRLTREYPDAAPGSMVGAFVEAGTVQMDAFERAETPWDLVEEMLSGDRSTLVRYLITEGGQPVAVLTRRTVVRGGTAKDAIPKGVVQPQTPATGWARFLQAADQIAPTAQEQGRVVNSWFADQQGKTIGHTYALAANRIYQLGVNIGSPSDRAHVVGEQPALDARLVSYLIGEGRPLMLRVDSEDIIVLDREREVSLPKSGSTPDVHFRVATPVQTGLCRLRLGVYFENNLVQSYLVCARVAPTEEQMPEGTGDGWWSECEYALSSDLTNLQDLRQRRVCLWIGEGKEGVRRAGISESTGLDMGPALQVNIGLIGSALAHYRDLLNRTCFEDPDAKQPRYLYKEDHTPLDPKTFENRLLDLAELGQTLYDRVFGTENGRRVAECLHGIERTEKGPVVVQIARLSLDAALPWAVLYDRPLRYNPRRNEVCSRFLQEGTCGVDCPHAGDPNVVCPYGFWGFRYVIEQPLRPPGAYSSVATHLPAADRPRMALVYGTGLGMTDRHREQVSATVGSRADAVLYDSTDALLAEMRSGPAVVYFYCHGGNTPFRQWLVVRDDDPLMPAYLDDGLRSDWAEGAPLVVLNGCHTGKYEPSTLLSFIHRFGELGAAGVVGTEIPIHEYLGNAFGPFLLGRLLAGDPVGQIVYDFRRELLQKRNLLGLVYVPYCYADLRMVS